MPPVLPLTKIAETAKTITLGWETPPGQEGYVALLDGQEKLVDGKRHASTSETANQVKIGKPPTGTHTYGVRLLGASAEGVWPPPAPPALEDFTWSPPVPKVNTPVTFMVVNPRHDVVYGWDRTDDLVPEFKGLSYVYGYQSPGPKKMNLLADGVIVRTYTFNVEDGVVTPPDPPDPPPAGTVLKPTYEYKITAGHYDANDGPSPNYQAGWTGKQNGTYQLDRVVSDEFAGVLMFQIEQAWDDARQGAWGRMWNGHNTSLEKDQAGWATAPGNSAWAVDYIGGDLGLNIDDNDAGPKNYTLKANLPKGVRHTLATRTILGRTDGSTARPGRSRMWLNGTLVLDTGPANTVWKFSNGVIQRYMWVWAGFYSRGVEVPLPFKMMFPFYGATPKLAMAQKVGGEGGAWALSTIPIPGRDHSQGPATCVQLPSWGSADAQLPSDWLTAA